MASSPKPTAATPLRAVAFASLAVLGGCASPAPFASAEIVVANERTVTLKAGSWRATAAEAERYCALHGKRAVYTGRQELNPGKITSLYYYDCVPKDR